uniref:Uncharacterized protein n=2 Tax=Meloidogyne hapla TaxID=6305 RepID=A0A1I8BJP6_MELHA
MKFILFALFFAPCSNSLFKDTDVNLENLPEYSEFIKQLRPSTTTPLPLIIGFPNGNLPTIQLCKESPGDDIYGHIFCWGMIGLYFVLILSLIVYQLRSFFWGAIESSLDKKSKDVEQKLVEARVNLLIFPPKTPSVVFFEERHS